MNQYKSFHHRTDGWIQIISGIPEEEKSVHCEKFGKLHNFSAKEGADGCISYLRRDGFCYFLRNTTGGVSFYHGVFGRESELSGYAADQLSWCRGKLERSATADLQKSPSQITFPPLVLVPSFGREYAAQVRDDASLRLLLAAADALLGGKSVIFRLKESARTDDFLRAILHFFPMEFANGISFASGVSTVLGGVDQSVPLLIGFTGSSDEAAAYADNFTVLDEERRETWSAPLSGEYMRFCGECAARGKDVYAFAAETSGAFSGGAFDAPVADALAAEAFYNTLSGQEKRVYCYEKAQQALQAGGAPRLAEYLSEVFRYSGGEEEAAELREHFCNLFADPAQAKRAFGEINGNYVLEEELAAALGAAFSEETVAYLVPDSLREYEKNEALSRENAKSFCVLLNLFFFAAAGSCVRDAAAQLLLGLCKAEKHVEDRFSERVGEAIGKMTDPALRLYGIAFFAESWTDANSAEHSPGAVADRGKKVLSLLGGSAFERAVAWLDVKEALETVRAESAPMPAAAAEELVRSLGDEDLRRLCSKEYAKKLIADDVLRSKTLDAFLASAAKNIDVDNYSEYEAILSLHGLSDADSAYAQGNAAAQEVYAAIERCRRSHGIENEYIARRCEFLDKRYSSLSVLLQYQIARNCGFEFSAQGAAEVRGILAAPLSAAEADREVFASKQRVADVMARMAGKNRIASAALRSAPAHRIVVISLIGLVCFLLAAFIAFVPVLVRTVATSSDFLSSASSYITAGHLLYPCAAFLVYAVSQWLTYIGLLRGYTNEQGAYRTSVVRALLWCLVIAILPGIFFDAGWIVFYFVM